MVGGQGVLDREPLGGPRIPGRHGEAIEFGTVLGWRRVDRYREVERAARPVERAMVLRSRWEYHSSRAPFEGAGYPFAILRRGSPYSLYPLEPAESGTISKGGGFSFQRDVPECRVLQSLHERFLGRAKKIRACPALSNRSPRRLTASWVDQVQGLVIAPRLISILVVVLRGDLLPSTGNNKLSKIESIVPRANFLARIVHNYHHTFTLKVTCRLISPRLNRKLHLCRKFFA